MFTELTALDATAFDNLRQAFGQARSGPWKGPGRDPGRPLTDRQRHLVRIARRALNQEADTSQVARRAHAAAHRLGGGRPGRPGDDADLVLRVALELEKTYLGGLPSAAAATVIDL
jgi:hypothetical protein